MARVLLLLAGVASIFAFGTYAAIDKSSGFIFANFLIAAMCLSGALYSVLKTNRFPRQKYRGELFSCTIKTTVVMGLSLSCLTFLPETRWDIHSTAPLPISTATQRTLEALNSPITGLFYRSPGDPRVAQTRRLLKSISSAGPAKFEEKLLAESDKNEGIFSNTLVLRIRKQKYVLKHPNEGAINEVLLRSSLKSKAQWLIASGYGEGNVLDTGPGGYSGFYEALKTEGHHLSRWIAGIGEPIPEDTTGILVLRPIKTYSSEVTKRIVAFLNRGGRVALFTEPAEKQPLRDLLDTYGVEVSTFPAIDPDAPSPPLGKKGLIVQRYSKHPISRDLEVGHVTFFPFASALGLRKTHPMDQLTGIAFTGINGKIRGSKHKTDFLPVAAALEPTRNGGQAKIAIFGDSEFISNKWLRSAYNLDLVLNTFAWLIEDDNSISIRAKTAMLPTRQSPLSLAGGLQAFLNVGLIVPEIFLMLSAVSWFRQRFQGSKLSAR